MSSHASPTPSNPSSAASGSAAQAGGIESPIKGGDAATAHAGPKALPRWRDVWQLPLAVAGAAALGAGIYYAIKTAPKVDRSIGLIQATTQVQEGKYTDALGTLNSQILPHIGKDILTAEQEHQFFILRARAIYLGQQDMGLDRPENDQNIISEYRQAEDRGAILTPTDRVYRGYTYLRMNNIPAAIAELHAIEDTDEAQSEQRLELHKSLINTLLATKVSDPAIILDLLTSFNNKPDITTQDRLWALERQAKLLINQGYADDAISRILRAMPRLDSLPPRSVGLTLLTLAEAYIATQDFTRASEQLARAADLLGETHELYPKAIRLLAMCDQNAGGDRIHSARERFSKVVSDWASSPELPESLLGLAEVQSYIGNTQDAELIEQSLETYSTLVDVVSGRPFVGLQTHDEASHQAASHTQSGELSHQDHHQAASDGPLTEASPESTAKHEALPHDQAQGHDAGSASQHANTHDAPDAHANQQAPHGKVPPKSGSTIAQEFGSVKDPNSLAGRLLLSLVARFSEQMEVKNYDRALQFAALALTLSPVDQCPPDLIIGMARAHQQLAAILLGKDSDSGKELPTALTLAQADPATQKEARNHLIRAAEYYRAHAGRVVQSNAVQYGNSLWNAADMYDRAGDFAGSSSAFQQFAADFPGDARKSEAIYRLAQAMRAAGDMEQAARHYRTLISSRGDSRDAGPFADASYVPLAQSLLLDGKPENDPEAEELLQLVIRGDLTGAGTKIFKDALRALGEHYYETGRYERAIERLSEFLERSVPADLTTSASAAARNTKSLASNAPAQLDDEGLGANGEVTTLPEWLARADVLSIRFKLADSYRLSAQSIAAGFSQAMPDSQRKQLEQARQERLEQAIALFDDVQRGYERMPRPSAIDQVRMRNAYFYKADCAYELMDYATAIRLYDAAKERYPKDAASLVAMTQIVACLLHEGKTAEAMTAQQRAKRFYESLPETAWDDPHLPMTRKQWEIWLDSQTRLATVSPGSLGQPPDP